MSVVREGYALHAYGESPDGSVMRSEITNSLIRFSTLLGALSTAKHLRWVLRPIARDSALLATALNVQDMWTAVADLMDTVLDDLMNQIKFEALVRVQPYVFDFV